MSLWSDTWEYRMACFAATNLAREVGFWNDMRPIEHLYFLDRRGAPVPSEMMRRIFNESINPERRDLDEIVLTNTSSSYFLSNAMHCLEMIPAAERYEMALSAVDSPETAELYAAATKDVGEIPRRDSSGNLLPGWVLSAMYARLMYEADCDRKAVIAEELERYRCEGLNAFASRPGYYQGKLIDSQRCWSFNGHQRFYRSLLEIRGEWSPGGWWTLYPERVPSSFQGFQRDLCEQAIARINELKTRGKGEGGSLFDLLSAMQSYRTVPWKRFFYWSKSTTRRCWRTGTWFLENLIDFLGWLISFFIPPLRRLYYTNPPVEGDSGKDDGSIQEEK